MSFPPITLNNREKIRKSDSTNLFPFAYFKEVEAGILSPFWSTFFFFENIYSLRKNVLIFISSKHKFTLGDVCVFHSRFLLQAWWDPLGQEGFLVIRDFQGQQVPLGELISVQESQGSQDHRGCLEPQGCRALRDQTVKCSPFAYIGIYVACDICSFMQKMWLSKFFLNFSIVSESS